MGFAAVLGVDAVQQFAGALAFLVQRVRALGAGFRDNSGDLTRAAGGAVERFIEQVGEEGRTFDDAVDESLREITDRILNLTVQDW